MDKRQKDQFIAVQHIPDSTIEGRNTKKKKSIAF